MIKLSRQKRKKIAENQTKITKLSSRVDRTLGNAYERGFGEKWMTEDNANHC